MSRARTLTVIIPESRILPRNVGERVAHILQQVIFFFFFLNNNVYFFFLENFFFIISHKILLVI
jgi:hypothetical protein